jgi:hypothetical protein
MKKGMGEIIIEIRKEKSKKKKVDLLKFYDHPVLRGMLELAYDNRLVWALPEGNPPYTPLEKSFDAQGHLYSDMRRMYIFLEGGHKTIKPLRRESIFVNLLEELDCDDAAFCWNAKLERSLVFLRR